MIHWSIRFFLLNNIGIFPSTEEIPFHNVHAEVDLQAAFVPFLNNLMHKEYSSLHPSSNIKDEHTAKQPTY